MKIFTIDEEGRTTNGFQVDRMISVVNGVSVMIPTLQMLPGVCVVLDNPQSLSVTLKLNQEYSYMLRGATWDDNKLRESEPNNILEVGECLLLGRITQSPQVAWKVKSIFREQLEEPARVNGVDISQPILDSKEMRNLLRWNIDGIPIVEMFDWVPKREFDGKILVEGIANSYKLVQISDGAEFLVKLPNGTERVFWYTGDEFITTPWEDWLRRYAGN